MTGDDRDFRLGALGRIAGPDADDRDAARIALAAFERICAASLAGAVTAADPGAPN